MVIIFVTKWRTKKLILWLGRECIFVEKEIFLWLRLSVGPMFYGSFTALGGSLEPSDKKDTQDTGNTKHWDTLHSGTSRKDLWQRLNMLVMKVKGFYSDGPFIFRALSIGIILPLFEMKNWKIVKMTWPKLVVAHKFQKKCCRLNRWTDVRHQADYWNWR